jgi:hypothetical protein
MTLPTRPRRTRRAAAAALVAGAALLLPLPVRSEIVINPQGWKFPNIITAAKEVIRVSDRTPIIEGKETILRGYRKSDGTHFMTYEIEGRVFGVQIDTNGKPPFEYSIMDADGDGKFETKLIGSKDSQDRAYVPQWIIDYYYSVHTDLKPPDAKAGSPGKTARAPAPSLKSVPPPTGPAAAAGSAPAAKPSPPPPEALKQANP